MSISADFFARAVDRMRDTKLITDEAHARLIAGGISDDANMALGMYIALLSVALWPIEDTRTRRERRRAK